MLNISRNIVKSVIKCVPLPNRRQCHSVFGMHKLIEKDGLENVKVCIVPKDEHGTVVDIIKKHFLPEQVFVKSRQVSLMNDHALDEYLFQLLRQGTTLYAKTRDDDTIAGVSLNFASCAVDSRNLRNFAYYRQDKSVKDFLNFMAKLDETPNLWNVFDKNTVFELKMLTVLPEYRRQGLAVLLADKSKQLAESLGYKVIRFNCINEFDYKVAERCMMKCVAMFPLHKLRSATSPYIKKNSDFNKVLRVYVDLINVQDKKKSFNEAIEKCKVNLEDCLN